MNIVPNKQIPNILYGIMHVAHHLSLAQTKDEEPRSPTTAVTGVGSEVLLHREGTSIDILVEESGQPEEQK